jgi:hypothetical protein
LAFTRVKVLASRAYDARTEGGAGHAGVVAAEIAPVLLLAPFAGVVVDRLSPVRVMVADLARVALAADLPLAADSVPAIYALAFGMSATSTFFSPAIGTVPPALVDEEELIAANSGIWTTAVLSQIVLAPAAGHRGGADWLRPRVLDQRC